MARLFELTARLLERVAADRTVVVALEDLHWADASTRHLLAYLFRTLRSGRLVVIATYRADDIHRRHPLRPLLAELDRLRTVRRIELGRFSRAEVGRQIAGILAHEPDPAQVDDIFERSDGNAFFVEELAVAAHQGCRTGLTDSLRDLLLVRVEGLPESAQRIARIVAEGGSTVEYPLLAAVARLAEDDLIEALRVAVGANILHASPGGDGYRFRHSLVREAVSDDLLPGERSRFNRRYAEALEADPTLVPGRRARHPPGQLLVPRARRRQGPPRRPRRLRRGPPPTRPLRATQAPGARDGAVGGHPRSHTGRATPSTTWRYSPLWLRPGHHPPALPRPDGRGRRGGPAVRGARARPEDHQAGAARPGGRGRPPPCRLVLDPALPPGAGTGPRETAATELATAQDLVRGLPPSEVHAEVLSMVAAWCSLHEPGPGALSAAQRAVEYARMVGTRDIELNARLTLGGLMVDAGDVETGIAEMYKVEERVLRHAPSMVTGRVRINLPSHLESVGRSREAVTVLREGIELARKSGLLDTEAWVWGNLLESLYALGRSGTRPSRPRATRWVSGSANHSGSGAMRLADLALARGDLAEAARQLAAARAHFGTHDPMPQHSLPLVRTAIGIAAGEGHLLDARAALEDALDAGFPARHPARRLAAAARRRHRRGRRPRTARRRGGPRRDPGAAAHGRQVPGHRSARLARPRTVGTRRAPPRRGHGRPARVVRGGHRLRTAGAPLRPRPCPAPPGRVPADRGRRRGRPGPRHGASARLVGAAAGHLGARPLADTVALLAQRARLALGRAPEPVRTPAPADPAEALGLTSRERDVLRLVAAGRSNRQIAEELFISPKTASVHVSNILAKLDVSGRGEAAALAHRLRLFPRRPPRPGRRAEAYAGRDPGRGRRRVQHVRGALRTRPQAHQRRTQAARTEPCGPERR